MHLIIRRLAFLILLAVSHPAFSQITSTFDSSSDGWTYLNGSTPVTVAFNASGGNPGGYGSVTYSSNVALTTQHWVAPAQFLGNHLVRSYGMQIKFDLQQSIAGASGTADVRIEKGSSFISFTLPTKPAVAPAWTSYALTLDTSTDWKFNGGATATDAQIRAILVNVTEIQIRGAYASNASYTSGLDNVILEQRTLASPPSIGSISATAGFPGDQITITGSGFNALDVNNIVYFGRVKGKVNAASTTQLTVEVPIGASYDYIKVTNIVTGMTSRSSTPFNAVFADGGRVVPASFKPKFSFSTIFREGFWVADFDGDGWEDIAVTNNDTDDVIDIYLNLGTGGTLSAASFAPKISFPAPQLGGSGTNGAGLMFADLDGDGLPDAVTSNSTSPTSSAFVTLRNTSTPGNLSFQSPEYWAGGSDETPINLIDDFDGDGRPELLAGEGSVGSSSFSYFWFVQNISSTGDIEFGSPVFPFNGTVVNGFAGATSGDLDGDGKPELIISHNFGDKFTVLTNVSTPGNPSFQNSFTIFTGQYSRPIRIADVNLDGKNDILWKMTGGGIRIRLNSNTDATLTAADFADEYILTSDLGANGGFTLLDFNGDGKVDIASTDDADVGIYENVYSGGAFSTAAFVPAYQVSGAGSGSSSPVGTDLNHDGKLDLVIASGSSFTILENKNTSGPIISLHTISPLSATVGSTVTITGSNFSSTPANNEVWFGDVRTTPLTASPTQLTVAVPAGAGYRNVSVRKGEFSSSYHLPFSTRFTTGTSFTGSHFAAPVSFTLTGADYDIEVGDLDLDGKPDVVAEGSGFLARFFQNTHSSGSISTSSLTIIGTTATGATNPKLIDVDGDGKFEIVGLAGRFYPNTSTVGSLSFGTGINIGNAAGITAADYNLDGKPDLSSTTTTAFGALLQMQENLSKVGTFADNGTFGTFSSVVNIGRPSNGGSTATGDFDNDGFWDAVTSNPSADNLSIFHNAQKYRVNSSIFDTRVDLTTGDTPGRVYTGDFNSDGLLDLLVYHGGTNTTLLSIFENTSTPGSLTFNRVDLTNPSATTVAHVADVDGDGKPDILTTSETGNRFTIFRNIHTTGPLSAASFEAPFNTTITGPRGITTGDLNLDGRPEILVTRAAGFLVVFENLIPFSVPTISSFTPDNGPVGTVVTITGTNFSTTPASNIVAFNGTTATVSASTATSITTTVPPGATTGPITVTVSGNTATSSTPFTVTTGPVITINAQPSDASVCIGNSAGFTTEASGTTNITYRWQFSLDGTTYNSLSDDATHAGTGTAAMSVTALSSAASGFYRCKIDGDLAATVYTNGAFLTVNALPLPPIVTNGEGCAPSAQVLLQAGGGVPGGYRWYTVPTGGTAIPGETNLSYLTPFLTTTTSYYVSNDNGVCESTRTLVVANIYTPPSKPTVTSSIPLTNNAITICSTTTVTLTAPGGVTTYFWTTDEDTQSIDVSYSGTFSVVTYNHSCASPNSDDITITVIPAPCNNEPPVIADYETAVIPRSVVQIDLNDLFSDPDNNIDLTTFSFSQPQSGATISLSGTTLEINYTDTGFSGTDTILIGICDSFGECVQKNITIEVAADVVVYNALSPTGANPTFVIQFIDVLPDTKNNTVTIFDRWQNEVWKANNYDNSSVVFRGTSTGGAELPTGTYYYRIDFASGRKSLTGFISLKR